jgi:hypothetical protein
MASARRIPDVAKEVLAKEVVAKEVGAKERERESGKAPSGSNDGSVEATEGGAP